MHALSEGGMSAMVTWQARARDCEPRLQMCRSCTLTTPSTASMPERIWGRETPRGVPSSRIFSVSRTMPMLDQRISAAMSSESTGSIQFCR